MVTAFQLLTGAGLDALIGDPRWLPHPIRWLGKLIESNEQLWRGTRLPLRVGGSLFCLSTIALSAAVVWVTLPLASIYWIFALLALRSLDAESAAVVARVRSGDFEGARRSLAMIVGRDTGQLDQTEIVRAAIETVAENLSDAVIAPLFYLAIAGPVGMAVYKTINTLDSMVGYKNERYAEFGWTSARLDDVVNWIPARLSAGLVWLAALISGGDFRRSIRVTFRDGSSQPSPNAGYPEAAFAGALQVRLGGLNIYKGQPSPKAFLGDPIRPLDVAAFRRARRLLWISSALFIGILALILPWSWF